MPSSTTHTLIGYSLTYLSLEYSLMLIYGAVKPLSSSQSTGTWGTLYTLLVGIFGGIGPWLYAHIPTFLVGFLIFMHVVMLLILLLWIAQSIAGVSPL